MKKVLYVLFAICVLCVGSAWASPDVNNFKTTEVGAFFSTEFGPVQLFGDFGSYVARSNGGGPEKSSLESYSSKINIFYKDSRTGVFHVLTFRDTHNPDSMYLSKNLKHASLVFDSCNPDGYCLDADVSLLGSGDLVIDPYTQVYVYSCRYYRFHSVAPHRVAKGAISYTVWSPEGGIVLEGSEPTVNAQILRGSYTFHEMDVPNCE